jgi:hypothetical protein
LERTIRRCRWRLNWLKEDDANTSYFQHHARYRNKKNFIAKIKVADRVLMDQEEKKEAIWEFYNNLLGTTGQRDFTLDLQNFHIPATDLSDLEQVFTEEVWSAIKVMPFDKALGLDGYMGRFYKVAWEVIKPDFMAVVSRLMQGDVSCLFLLNSAYVTLLPKMADAMEVKDFRQVSLVHSFAKIVTKLLANHLAPKLPSLISCNHGAFVKGRCILDNFMLVQETTKALHRQKALRLLLKLDITKAFDSVSWPFLLEVM